MSTFSIRTTPYVGVVAAAVCAVAASAMPHWEYVPGGDFEFNVLTADGDFVHGAAESRVGNGDTTGAWEQAIWGRYPWELPPVSWQHDIVNGANVDFEVSWRESDTALLFTVGTQTISWNGIFTHFTDVFVRVFASWGPDAFMRLTDLELVGSGLQLPDMEVANGVEFIRINQYGAGPMTPFGDFTLTGTHNFSWVDSFPPEGGLSVRVYLTWVIPTPGGAALFAVVGAFAARRQRR